MSLLDDLQADLVADALAKPATRPARNTAWSNAASFTDGGYLAKATRQTCECCGAAPLFLQAIFHVELAPNGARRLQALVRGAQWPMWRTWPLEVDETTVPWCATCLQEVGFTLTPVPETRTLAFGESHGIPAASARHV